MSKLGLASRAEARRLILSSRVRVNGRTVSDPSTRVIPEQLAIEIDGVAARRRGDQLTIALHKPRGYVTTRSDPEGRTTVYDLLDDVSERLVAVGRLDLATSGLLLFTNDTQFANWLTDPANAIPRVYLVTVEGRVKDETTAKLQLGVTIDDEQLSAQSVEIRKASGKESHLIVTLTEGKNREIRRMLEAAGHPVTHLRRVQFGGIELGQLPPGKWRIVDAAEVRTAFPGYRPKKYVPKPK